MFAIRQMRDHTGMSQQQVADALEVSKRRYAGWEREEREINLSDAIRLADLFGCTLDELANHEVKGTGPVTQREVRILDVYRSVDDRGKECIDRAVDGELLGMLSRATEKEVGVTAS